MLTTDHWFQRTGGYRSGTAATEFALVLPILMLLALACADFGRIAHHYQVVCNAARTGAETGAIQQFTDSTRAAWEAEVRQAAIEELQNLPQFGEADLTFDLSTTTDADNVVRVAVDVAYPFRTVVAWPALPVEVMLRKRIEFRQFR